MHARQRALLRFAAAAALTAALAGGALAQGRYLGSGNSQNTVVKNQNPVTRGKAVTIVPSRGKVVTTLPPRGNGNHGPWIRRGPYGGWGPGGTGIVVNDPDFYPPNDGQAIGNSAPQQQRTTRRNSSNALPPGERRIVPDEVVIELSNAVSQQRIEALQRRHRLTWIESQTVQLTGTTLLRWRISGNRSVASVVRALEADNVVAQPNFVFDTKQGAPAEGDPAQYALAILHLPDAHAIAKGDGVLVAVIDSGIDADHSELAGAIAGSYDALPAPMQVDKHGTAIASLIAAHGKLMGAAPNAKILAIRAFNPKGTSAQGTTFSILKGLDWAVANHARVINMSFAGPNDAALHRSLEAAHKQGIVLIAAAGNDGPKAPPLYPAADANVIAVSATDSENKAYPQSNRGIHIAVAAPGSQILVAIPDEAYEVSSGTSYSAAEVSGIVALMLERRPELTPDKVREILVSTATDIGPKGRDIIFGAGLADAYAALLAEASPVAAAVPLPVSRAESGAH